MGQFRMALIYNPSMVSELAALAVQIVRLVDDHQPGIVECEFNDADGRRHTLIDKAPIFSTELLDAHSKYPQPGMARCTVLRVWNDPVGRELITISTAAPFSIESIEGQSQFVVLQSKVSPVANLQR